jgi:sulfur carrier protein
MKISLNGSPLTLDEPSKTIAELLKTRDYNGKLVAVALNGAFLPKIKYQDTKLSDGDSIEIVAPMQGG